MGLVSVKLLVRKEVLRECWETGKPDQQSQVGAENGRDFDNNE